MTDPFVAEIRIFAGNFAPRGWAFCNGQIMPINQNTALFSLLGTNYGGDGRNTFALPNLQGRAPMHPGQGPGLDWYNLGEMTGSETVTLLTSEMPAHNHAVNVNTRPGDLADPTDHVLARSGGPNVYQTNASQNQTPMAGNTLAAVGGSQPHNNMQPYLSLNFIIALQGVYPPRS